MTEPFDNLVTWVVWIALGGLAVSLLVYIEATVSRRSARIARRLACASSLLYLVSGGVGAVVRVEYSIMQNERERVMPSGVTPDMAEFDNESTTVLTSAPAPERVAEEVLDSEGRDEQYNPQRNNTTESPDRGHLTTPSESQHIDAERVMPFVQIDSETDLGDTRRNSDGSETTAL